jgi:hypothetical protein
MVLIFFSISVFLSAALLFLVEPMVAKMMLPLLGGSPAVWNTCLVFFQAALMAGYSYTYAANKWLKWRVLLTVQCTLVLIPALVGTLPIALPHDWVPPADSNPIPWILLVLSTAVGGPFLVLASSGPMLQRWFAESGHRRAEDPYFLYAASNAGSLAGLIAYPLLMEPLLRISVQSRLWTFGYGLFAAFTLVCALSSWRRIEPSKEPANGRAEDATLEPIPSGTRLRWIALAFVPSSLMLGATSALTADVPAIPLFWVIPLALYLLSFVLVFARRQVVSPAAFNQRLPMLILCGLVPGMLQTKLPLAALVILYSILLFSVAMVCHGELAASRPSVKRLTEFYLLMSLGGVLGGIFNSIVAPVVFHSVLEFPIILICAALLRRPVASEKPDATKTSTRRNDWLLPAILGVGTACVFLMFRRAGIIVSVPLSILIFGLALVFCLSFGKRPLRFGLGCAALFLASFLYVGPYGHILHTDRSFFGVYRVTNDQTGRFRYFLHGGTVHGIQSLNAALSRVPLAYYTADGPAGQVARAVQARMPDAPWAIVGLGAGAMACLSPPSHSLTYYEIDPLVAKVAENPAYFTFLQNCAPQVKLELGDARLKLRNAPDAHYGLLVLDAFSGDSVPMHLLTREALALYLRKIAPGGIIAFHVTNQYLNLAPVLGNLAQDAQLACREENDANVSEQQSRDGKFASRWIVMARDPHDLEGLVNSSSPGATWVPIQGHDGAKVWTDDYSNLLSVIRWK